MLRFARCLCLWRLSPKADYSATGVVLVVGAHEQADRYIAFVLGARAFGHSLEARREA